MTARTQRRLGGLRAVSKETERGGSAMGVAKVSRTYHGTERPPKKREAILARLFFRGPSTYIIST